MTSDQEQVDYIGTSGKSIPTPDNWWQWEVVSVTTANQEQNGVGIEIYHLSPNKRTWVQVIIEYNPGKEPQQFISNAMSLDESNADQLRRRLQRNREE